MKLFLATKNKDKILEIKHILQDLKIEILSMYDIENIPDVIEDKETIEENAAKKALEIAEITGLICLADDTGFFVEALDGKPGVKAARFAGESSSYKDNRDKMLHEMKGKINRSAEFRTAVVLAKPGEIIAMENGAVKGEITDAEIGIGGFGYDSIFRAKETGKTFGEMSSVAKHKISHRARALRKIQKHIEKLVN